MQQALVMPDRKQDGAAWVIRTRLHNVSCAVNALTGFATASLKEDCFGILQLTDPTLGTILQAILSLQLVLERHLRSTASTGSRRYAHRSGRGRARLSFTDINLFAKFSKSNERVSNPARLEARQLAAVSSVDDQKGLPRRGLNPGFLSESQVT